jgi:hypothetical protein
MKLIWGIFLVAALFIIAILVMGWTGGLVQEAGKGGVHVTETLTGWWLP